MSVAGEAGAWSKGLLVRVGACPACGRNGSGNDELPCRDHRGDMSQDNWTMSRCGGCQSLYLDPRPDPGSLALAYDSYYTHHREQEVVPVSGPGRLGWKMIHGYLNAAFGFRRRPALGMGRWVFGALPPWKLKLDYYARHLFADRHPRGGRLLDVGCGNGEFVARAAEMGWVATGIDPDPKAVAACKEHGLDVIEGTVQSLSNRLQGTFDVVALSHSLEHVPNPLHELKSVARLLRPCGTLWLALPNPRSLGARVFGGDWRELHPPYHLCIPAPRQLQSLLESAGLEDIRFRRRGAHARRMMRESAENARIAGGLGRTVRALLAPVLRVVADVAATVVPGLAEETVVIARRRRPG